jgi:hypothetical protein
MMTKGGVMRNGCAAAALIGAALLAVTACGSGGTGTTATFHPEGSMPASAPSAPDAPGGSGTSFVMPAFGKNVHVEMTNWLPSAASQAQAVLTDKDYELAYLYAEYTSGQDTSWTGYVSPTMQTEVQTALSQPDVTGESFTGTIGFFDMSAVTDPTVGGYLDVSACFDNAESSNTSAQTGKVIPDTTPAAEHYYRYTDQLAKNSAGEWKVVSDLPRIYYPQAKECKP